MTKDLALNKVHHMDCLDGLKLIKDGSIDFAFTDPPFGIEFHKINAAYFNKNSRNPDIKYKDFSDEKDYAEWANKWIKETYRVLKDDGAFCLVSGWSNVSYLDLAARNAGFKMLNHCIWKYEFGLYTKRKFTTSHYHILCYVKTKDLKKSKYFFQKQKQYDEDVILEIRRNGTNIKGHPCALPPKLVEKFIRSFTKENDLIMDIFMGSGTTAVVAKQSNRRFIGFEKKQEYLNLLNQRLQSEAKKESNKITNWVTE
jgi:site-specific DNA-methyltransferase (adenine-specific)